MIRFSSSGRPIHRYAVILLAYRDGGWREVRVFDNHLGEHHQHRYTRAGGKADAELFHPGPTNQAIAAAIDHLKTGWAAIILSWDT